MNQMQTVFLLNHSCEREETNFKETRTIGIYSTQKKAEEAMTLVKALKGFSDYPDGFEIEENELDKTWWEVGFFRQWH